jgi:hypothetical protein
MFKGCKTAGVVEQYAQAVCIYSLMTTRPYRQGHLLGCILI